MDRLNRLIFQMSYNVRRNEQIESADLLDGPTTPDEIDGPSRLTFQTSLQCQTEWTDQAG